MKFVKMHGCGNDYVYLDAASGGGPGDGVLALMDGPGWGDIVRRMSDRHTGIGGDGVIVVCRPTQAGARAGAHARMRMFNADGSESEMCGNGVRCVAKFAHDRLGVRAAQLLIETGRGVLSIDCRTEGGRVVSATVDMGAPILELDAVPVDRTRLGAGDATGGFALPGVAGVAADWRFVSMGNPHAVSFATVLGDGGAGSDGANDPLAAMARLGPTVERHAAFPRRINVHVVHRRGPSEADVFTWERGAGITRACGTGACAALVAGVLGGLLGREALLHVPGGELRIRWDGPTGRVFMTGEAVDVFEGEWPD